MISMNMATELGTKNISYRLQNIILGILSKSGGIPWVLEAPMDDVDCFIGLDVGTQETGIHYPSCSVCLDGTGNLIGYYATSIAQNGEKIDEAALEKIFDQVLIAYKTKHHTYPHHVVIHRDGFSNEGIEWYVQYFQRNNIIFDLVEIRKNISTRLLHPEQISNEMNPNTIGCKVTLRGERMYEFVDRFFNIALPRVRDFRGINGNGFDGRGNFACGIKEQIIFPEIDFEKVDAVRGMDVCFVTTAKTDEEGKELLKALGAPFAENN